MNSEEIQAQEDLTSKPPEIPESQECPICHDEVKYVHNYCGRCAYPIQGSRETKVAYRRKYLQREVLLSKYLNRITGGKVVIYILMGISILFFLIMYFLLLFNPDYLNEKFVIQHSLGRKIELIILLGFALIAAAFILIAIWAQKSPGPALLVTTTFFISMQLLSLGLRGRMPSFLTFLIQGVLLFFLIRGLFAALKKKRLIQLLDHS